MNHAEVASCQLSVASGNKAGVLPLPAPRVPIHVRPATMADLPFMDALQKRHTKQVGWMPTKQLEGKIKAGHVLIAEAMANSEWGTMNDESEDSASAPFTVHRSSFSVQPTPVGYVIGHDQYFKRDDVGIIYQMNVAPSAQRSFVGATLLKAMFDRAAYGCRLFCCWCAQDIEANRFWESMGFVPLAFRAGSRGKQRVHIFWQKRICRADVTTPYWFPSQTSSGSMREDRLVLPIPPGTHWSDAKPIVLPQEQAPGAGGQLPGEQAPGAGGRLPVKARRLSPSAPAIGDSQPATPAAKTLSGFAFAPPIPPQVRAEKPKRPKRQAVKNDPRHVAAARELRDRWLERVNSGQHLPEPAGKYDLSKELAAPTPREILQLPPPIAA